MEILSTIYHAPLGAFGIGSIIASICLFMAQYYLCKNTIIATGKFKGVITCNSKNKKNLMYKNVFTFIGSDGMERICRSGISSSTISSKAIDSPQKIRYSPHNPNFAKPANNIYLFIGLATLLLGIVIFSWYLSLVNFGFIAFISIITIFSYLFFKYQKLIKKSPKWAQGLNLHHIFIESMASNTTPLTSNEKLIENDHVAVIQNNKTGVYRKFVPLYITISLLSYRWWILDT